MIVLDDDNHEPNYARGTIERARLPFDVLLDTNEEAFAQWRADLRDHVDDYLERNGEGDSLLRGLYYFSMIDSGPGSLATWFVGPREETYLSWVSGPTGVVDGHEVAEEAGEFILDTYVSVTVGTSRYEAEFTTPSKLVFTTSITRGDPDLPISVYGVNIGQARFATSINRYMTMLHEDFPLDMIDSRATSPDSFELTVYVYKLPFRVLMTSPLFATWRRDLSDRLATVVPANAFTTAAPPPSPP
jgi:hypothetical protein